MEQKIIQLYKKGLSSRKIGKIVKRSATVVLKILKRNGIAARGRREINKKYLVNSNFFDRIDSHDKAYILGLLFADGYNDEESGYIMLGLKEQDKSVLEKINAIIQPTRGFYTNSYHKTGKKYLYTYITDKRISEKLAGYGCVQRKSLILQFPKLNRKFLSSFVLGYFDGDGGISKTGNRYCMYFYGAHDFLHSLQNVLKKTVKIETRLEKTPYSIYRLLYGKTESLHQLINWMYKKQTWSLDRKRSICDAFIKAKASI